MALPFPFPFPFFPLRTALALPPPPDHSTPPQVMRDTAPVGHEDINRNQIALSLALCENLFLMLVQQRAALNAAYASLQDLGGLGAVLEALRVPTPAEDAPVVKKKGKKSKAKAEKDKAAKPDKVPKGM